MKLKKQVLPEFVIVQHERDIEILQNIKTYFNCGYIKRNHQDRFCFIVRNTNDLLTKIIPFFEKYPLKTKKSVDYENFKKILILIKNKKHLTQEGLDEIEKIMHIMRKYYINQGKRSSKRSSPSFNEN